MSKRKRTLKKILISVVLLFWAVVALYGFKQTDTSSSSSGLQTVTVGYQKGDPFDIAKQRGEFVKKMKAKGYRVVFKEFQDGNSLMQALKGSPF